MTNSINNELELSEEELYYKIGLQLARHQKYATPPDRKELIKMAKARIAASLQDISNAICGNDNIRRIAKSEDTLLASAIADLITGIVTGVAPITVACLIVKRGLHELCNWK